MLIPPLAPSGCPILICSPFNSSTLHSAPVASLSQALKFGTLSLQLSKRTFAQLLSAVISKQLNFSSWPSDPLSSFLLAPQIQLPLTIVRVYKFIIFTYLLVNISETILID